MYVDMDNEDNSPLYKALLLIISANINPQSPLCGLLHRGFLCPWE